MRPTASAKSSPPTTRRTRVVRAHMCVGIVKQDLMVRVGPAAYDALVRQPHARRMDFTGRPMKGFVFVSAEGLERDADLERWVGHGLSHATSLPPKDGPRKAAPPKKRRSSRRRRGRP